MPSTQQSQYLSLLKKNILFEDKNLLIFNKPHNLAVQGGNKVTISVDDLLKFFSFNNEKPRLTHRIDKDTSGILITAKNSKTATLITKLFQKSKINKTYFTIVVGKPKKQHGVINTPLAKKTFKNGKEYVSTERSQDTKPAKTLYKIIDHLANELSFLAVTPITGRKHQIRVHLSSINLPILGDGKYGGKKAFKANLSNKIHLHAYQIIIPNYNGKDLKITAPLPPHIQKTFNDLGFSADLFRN